MLLEERSRIIPDKRAKFVDRIIDYVITNFFREFYHNVRIVSLYGLIFVKYKNLNKIVLNTINTDLKEKTYRLNYLLKKYIASLTPIDYPIDNIRYPVDQYSFLLKTIHFLYKKVDFNDFFDNQVDNLYGLTNEQIVLEHWFIMYFHNEKLFDQLIKKTRLKIKESSVHHMLKKLIRYNFFDNKELALIYYKIILDNYFEDYFSNQFMYSDNIRVSFLEKVISYCDQASVINLKIKLIT